MALPGSIVWAHKKHIEPGAPQKHWYEDFFNRFWSDDDGSLVQAKRITVLTFNYDRSFEFYLRTVATVRRKFTPSTAAMDLVRPHRVIVSQGPTIIHLHGQLGRLAGSTRLREYSPEGSVDSRRIAAAGLHLLSDANPDSREFVMARKAIRECNRLYFLGFGFHPKSVELLCDFAGDSMQGKIVSGTHAGVSGVGWEQVKREVLRERWIDFPPSGSVHAFLRENRLIGPFGDADLTKIVG